MEIFVNNIKVPCEEKLQLTLFNPLFNDTGDHSLPISFNAKHPVVRKAFGFSGHTGVDAGDEFSAKVRTGLIELGGVWKVTDSSEDVIETYFKGDSGNFYSLIGNTLLSSLYFGGIKHPIDFGGGAAEVLELMDTKMNAVYPDDEYTAFCAYMPNAYGDGTEAERQIVNEVEHDIGGNPTFLYKFEYLRNDTIYLFAGTILDYLFSEYGYRIERNIFRTDANLKHLVVFNAYNRKASTEFDYTKLVPRIAIKDFLKAISSRFNIGFFINERSKNVNIISFDEIIKRGAINLSSKFTSKPKIDSRRTSGINFPLNAPDDWSKNENSSIDDFLYTNLVTVDTFRDIAPGLGTLYYIYYVKAENAYYKIVYEDSAYSAVRACPGGFKFTEGTGDTEMTQYSGIPGMYRFIKTVEWIVEEGYPPVPVTHSTEADMVMPRYDDEVADGSNPDKVFPLMFVFARGKKESFIVPEEGAPESLKYPLGNNDIYDGQGNTIAGADLSLNLGGTNGTIETFWRNRLNWELLIKKTVKGELTEEEIHKLISFDQVFNIEKNNCLVNSLELEIDMRGVKIGEAELYRL